jgi:hypothetical protein
VKEIPLTRGYVVLVDDEDYEQLSKRHWTALVKRNNVYAYRVFGSGCEYLHRVVMGVTDPNIEVDHRDHNGLNCKKYNLRVCDSSQNGANARKTTRTTSSRYKGVNWHQPKGKQEKWRACCGRLCLITRAIAIVFGQECEFLGRANAEAELLGAMSG